MPKVLYSDNDYPDIELERELFRRHGIDVAVAQCRTEDEVIAAAQGCFGILVQYAPITERVLAALPDVGVVSRIGAGYDTIDTEACARHGVWVANSPDYGVGEVATHALGLALADVQVPPGTRSFAARGKSNVFICTETRFVSAASVPFKVRSWTPEPISLPASSRTQTR